MRTCAIIYGGAQKRMDAAWSKWCVHFHCQPSKHSYSLLHFPLQIVPLGLHHFPCFSFTHTGDSTVYIYSWTICKHCLCFTILQVSEKIWAGCQVVLEPNPCMQRLDLLSLVPRLSGTRNIHAWRAWYIFSRDHDVIKIGPRVFRTERQRFASYFTSFAFNNQCVWYSLPDCYIRVESCPLPFTLFPVLSPWVRPHATKVFLPPFYHWGFSREEKILGSLHMHKFNFLFWSGGAWEWG